jgi:hypothetical protein
VQVAVEEGLDGGIVPVYHFGNTQVGRLTKSIWYTAGIRGGRHYCRADGA